MYTDKTVPQAMSAINARLHTPGSRGRPQLDGWVEKSGRFALTVTTQVRWRFRRRTTLSARAERRDGLTVIEGNVPGGASREGQAVVFGALALVAVLGMIQGNAILAIVALAAGVVFFVLLEGDYANSEILLSELQKTLKAQLTPPRREGKAGTRHTSKEG
jgi:hypothetical protein